jgi:hypothetical protein
MHQVYIKDMKRQEEIMNIPRMTTLLGHLPSYHKKEQKKENNWNKVKTMRTQFLLAFFRGVCTLRESGGDQRSEKCSVNLPRYLKYLFPILFLIPLDFFIIGGGIGAGIQWSLFRYQNTYLGASFIPVTRDLYYIISGIISGKSAISGLLLIFSAIVLVVAFLLVMANRTRLSGILTMTAGILSLGSCCIQYGFLLNAYAGMCIPFGAPILLIYGFLLFRVQPELSGENLLEKYDYLFVLMGIFAIYSAYTIPYYTNDTIPSQLLPYYILHDHTIYLDGATSYINNYFYSYRFVDLGNGHFASLFPIVTPVLITPLYVIPVLILNIPMTDNTLLIMGKYCASLISAVAGMFVYLACRHMTTRKIALLTVVIFAFGTSTWSTSSQTLYAHGMVELLLAIMFYLTVRNENEYSIRNIIGLGICTGLFIFNRPSDSVLVLPFVLYVLLYYRSKITYYLGFGVISGAPFLMYNLLLFHHPLGGYALVASRMILGISTVSNFIGLLIAPNKGLLVFSPVLILSVFGFWFIHDKQERPVYRVLFWSMGAIILNLLVYALFDDWIGGRVYGPRYLTGILPFVAIGVCIFLDNLKNPVSNLKKMAITVLIIVSISVQFIGAFYYPSMFNDEKIPETIYDPWSIQNPIIINSLFYGDLKSHLHDITYNETQQRLADNNKDPGKKILPVSI